MQKVQGWVEKGNILVSVGGLTSSTKVQGSFALSSVTVYLTGTVTLATLYSDDAAPPTPLANPTTASSTGAWGFYAANGRYDVVFSGTVTPFTLSDLSLFDESSIFIDVTAAPFFAKGDGVTDDTVAINNALSAAGTRGTVFFPKPSSSYLISSVLTVPSDYMLLFGNAIIKAKADTSFQFMLTGTGRTGVVVCDLEFDVNGPNRITGQAVRYDGVTFPNTTDCSTINVTVRNTRGFSSSSAIGITASSATRFKVDGCRVYDCGANVTTLKSDGIFIRGNGCEIVNSQAYRCTDTAFVLEGCNYSIIGNCIAIDCTSIGGVSNDTASDCVGNIVNGLTGSCSFVGSTGGIFSLLCTSTGNLRQTTLSNISIRIEPAATGLGPGIQGRITSTGRIIDLTLNNCSVNTGAAVGVVAQGIYFTDCDYVHITNPYIKIDVTAGTRCIRFDGSCAQPKVTGGILIGGTDSVLVANTCSVAVIRDVNVFDFDEYGISVADTASVVSINNTYISASKIADEIKAAGATLVSDIPQSWTPTYSSDIGNQAATFTGTPTTTLAQYTTRGKQVTVVVNFSATLIAVTPQYLQLTLPSGVIPANDNQYGQAGPVNNSIEVEGRIRALNTGNTLRLYRTALALYTASQPVGGQFSFTFFTA